MRKKKFSSRLFRFFLISLLTSLIIWNGIIPPTCIGKYCSLMVPVRLGILVPLTTIILTIGISLLEQGFEYLYKKYLRKLLK